MIWTLLSERTRGRLAKMIKSGAQPLYVSAHTHLGFWRSRKLGGGVKAVELNVGSLLDAPVHFRDFQLFSGSAPDTVHSNAYLFSPNSNNGGNRVGELACNGAWYSDNDVNTTRRQERIELRDSLRGKNVLLKYLTETKNRRRKFLLANLRAELWEYQALVDTFPSSELMGYRVEIETELKLKEPDVSNDVAYNKVKNSHKGLLLKLRADETSVDSAQPRIRVYKACLAVQAAGKVPIHRYWIMRAYQKHIDCIKVKCAVIGGKAPSACGGLSSAWDGL